MNRYVAETLKMEQRLSSKGSIGVLPTGAILSSMYVSSSPSPAAGSQTSPFAANCGDTPTSSVLGLEHLPDSRPDSPMVNQGHLSPPPMRGSYGAQSPFLRYTTGSQGSSTAQPKSNVAGRINLSGSAGDGVHGPERYSLSRSPSPSLL